MKITTVLIMRSIECITDADHSIALSKTVLRGCVIVRQDSRAAPSRCETVPQITLSLGDDVILT